MPVRLVPVVNALGMHARAAARFVKTAGRFDASVQVSRARRSTDGTSILGLLLLAASQGTTIRIATSGPEADAALEALTRLVEAGIGDPDFSSGASGTGTDRGGREA